ncbi:MAG: GTP 3',8-cyclase MoaA [Caldilineae bacterium]|nr:MAG: GTP 3',8-cyclase MoaA [Caldilineae bacterium]
MPSVHLTTHVPDIATETEASGLVDRFGRRLNYLRISLTDVCNLRCVYCMPEKMTFRPRRELMSDEELRLIVRMMVELGITKIRLTGGEPTVRPNLVGLVRYMAQQEGLQDLVMTTNGILLPQLAEPLARAGLKRVNISVDTLNPHKFRQITRWGDLDAVWAGVEAAEAAGLRPIKINAVVTRGFNDDEVADLARLTLEREWQVRFIELMPFGSEAEFAQSAVVTSEETRRLIEAKLGPLQEMPGYDGRDPARPYRLPGARGTVGFISTISEPFCSACNRLRLTADGKLRLCLLRDGEFDLLTPLRAGVGYDELKQQVLAAAYEKPWGHGLPDGAIPTNRIMSQIGG